MIRLGEGSGDELSKTKTNEGKVSGTSGGILKKLNIFGQPLDVHHLLDLLNRIMVEIAFYK